jgi:hypothetical protein
LKLTTTPCAGDKIIFPAEIFNGTEVLLRSSLNSKLVKILASAIFTSTIANLKKTIDLDEIKRK